VSSKGTLPTLGINMERGKITLLQTKDEFNSIISSSNFKVFHHTRTYFIPLKIKIFSLDATTPQHLSS